MPFGNKRYRVYPYKSQTDLDTGELLNRIEATPISAFIVGSKLIVCGRASGTLTTFRNRGDWAISIDRGGAPDWEVQPWNNSDYPSNINLVPGHFIHFYHAILDPESWLIKIAERYELGLDGIETGNSATIPLQPPADYIHYQYVFFNDKGGIFINREGWWECLDNTFQGRQKIPVSLPEGYPKDSTHVYHGVITALVAKDETIYVLIEGFAISSANPYTNATVGIVRFSKDFKIINTNFFGNPKSSFTGCALTEGRPGFIYVAYTLGTGYSSEIRKFTSELVLVKEGWPRRVGNFDTPFRVTDINSTIQDVYVCGMSAKGPSVTRFSHSGNPTLFAQQYGAEGESWQSVILGADDDFFYLCGYFQQKPKEIVEHFISVQKFDRYGLPA